MSIAVERKLRSIPEPSITLISEADPSEEYQYTVIIKTHDRDIAKGTASYASVLFKAKRKRNMVLPGQLGFFEVTEE